MRFWPTGNWLGIVIPKVNCSTSCLRRPDGEINEDLPRAAWLVTFTGKGENALVETIVTYKSLSDLETVVQMGMEQGMMATLEKLETLLLTIPK